MWLSLKLRDQAVYLTLLQGLMDQERFFNFFNPRGYDVGRHIQERGLDIPYRVECLRGRKKNRRVFNTWISHDALQAWKLYFERVRGWPKEGEPGAVASKNRPLSRSAILVNHLYTMRKLGYINGKGGDTGKRYGYGLHELRDLARSLLEKAKQEGFNTLSCTTPDSRILTTNGTKDFGQLSVGDYVYGHDARFHKIEKILFREYCGKLYVLTPWLINLPVKLTPEHPILVAVHTDTTAVRVVWKRLKDVSIKDKLAIRKGSFSHAKQIDPDYARFIGYYLAEGSTHGNKGITFSFSSKETEYINDVVTLGKRYLLIDPRSMKN